MTWVLKNNTIENDDWMKSLPGYQGEVAIHDELARKYKASEGGPGSGNFGHAGGIGGAGNPGGSVGRAGAGHVPGEENRDLIVSNPLMYWPKQADILHVYYDTRINTGDRTTEAVKDKVVTRISKDTGLTYDQCNELTKTWAETSNDQSSMSLQLQQEASVKYGVGLSKWQQEAFDSTQKLGETSLEYMQAHEEYLALKDRIDNEAGSMSKEEFDAAVTRVGELEDTQDRLQEEFYTEYGGLGSEETEPPNMEDFADQYENALYQRESGAMDAYLSSVYQDTQALFKEKGYGPDQTIILYRGIQTPQNVPAGSIVEYVGNSLESWSFSPGVAGAFGNLVLAIEIPVSSIFSTPVTGLGCLDEKEVVIIGGTMSALAAKGS